MKKIFLSTHIITMLFTSCSKEKTIEPIKKLDVNEFSHLANKENPTDSEIELLDYNFKLLSNEEFIEFSLLSIDYLIVDLTEEEVNEFNNSKEFHLEKLKSFTEKAVTLFNKPITQLTNDELRIVLNETKTNYTKAACPSATFNQYLCRSAVYNTDPAGWQRIATPDDPTDCDYEFHFIGYKTWTHGKTWSAKTVLDWWGDCGIAARHTQFTPSLSSTGILIGDDAINLFFWGSGSFFKSKIGMR